MGWAAVQPPETLSPRQRWTFRPLGGVKRPRETSLDVLHLNFDCEAKCLSRLDSFWALPRKPHNRPHLSRAQNGALPGCRPASQRDECSLCRRPPPSPCGTSAPDVLGPEVPDITNSTTSGYRGTTASPAPVEQPPPAAAAASRRGTECYADSKYATCARQSEQQRSHRERRNDADRADHAKLEQGPRIPASRRNGCADNDRRMHDERAIGQSAPGLPGGAGRIEAFAKQRQQVCDHAPGDKGLPECLHHGGQFDAAVEVDRPAFERP